MGKNKNSKWLLMSSALVIPIVAVTGDVSASSLVDEAKSIKDKKEKTMQSITVKETEIEENKTKMMKLMEQLQDLEAETEKIAEEAEKIEAKIVRTKEDIRKLQDSIIELEDRIEKRDAVLKKRMQAMQTKNGKVNYLDVLLGSSSFSEFVDRFTSVSTIMRADREIMKLQQEDVEQLEKDEKELDDKLNDIVDEREKLTEQREKLEENKVEKGKIIDRMEIEQKAKESEKRELEEDFEHLSALEADVEKAIQEQQDAFYIAEQERLEGSYCSSTGEVSEDAYVKVFRDAGVLSGKSELVMKAAQANGIDPVLMGAIILHETGNGTSNAIKTYNNPGGMMSPSSNWSQLTRYASLEDGLDAMGKTLNRITKKEGKKTVAAIGSVYAPIGADNDPNGLNGHWVKNVNKNVEELGGLVGECEISFDRGSKGFILPSTGTLTSPYGWRMHPVDHVLKEHRGLDIANVSGTKIVAAGDGEVTHAGWLDGFGNSIMITHIMDGKMYTTVYGHLSGIGTAKGAKVKQGQEIGKMGKTGKVTGVHLHFELHVGHYTNFEASAVNPLRYIGTK